MEIALMAAETGHLVLSTLHTPDVYRTVSRMLSLSTGDPKEVRERIADTLQGIVAQRLVPRKDGHGLVLASEVLIVTGTVREAMKRPESNPPLKDLIEKGVHPYGMQTFEMHLQAPARAGNHRPWTRRGRASGSSSSRGLVPVRPRTVVSASQSKLRSRQHGRSPRLDV